MPPIPTRPLYIITRQSESDYTRQKWKSRTGELMVGFPDLPGGGIRCSITYFTLLPIKEGEILQAGHFYEYSGTFIAPLDTASLSMAVGYGQHVWVDHIKLDILHDDAPREYDCIEDASINSRASCHFPFAAYGHVIPFCSTYASDGGAWCALGVEDDGTSCINGCNDYRKDWEFCNLCTQTNLTSDDSASSFESDQRRTMEGEPCVFPFVYNGKTYTNCTTDPYDTWVSGFYPPTRPWCALDREAYRIGECAPCGDFEVSTSELEGVITIQSFVCAVFRKLPHFHRGLAFFALLLPRFHTLASQHSYIAYKKYRAISASRLFGGSGRLGDMGSQLRGDSRANDGRCGVFDRHQ